MAHGLSDRGWGEVLALACRGDETPPSVLVNERRRDGGAATIGEGGGVLKNILEFKGGGDIPELKAEEEGRGDETPPPRSK